MSESILQEAIRLTSSDRQGQYGHPGDHFARTVAGLNARFGTGKDPLFAREMEPQEWALMVALDKLVGRGNDTREMKRDSLVDAAGYCRTYEMCVERVPPGAGAVLGNQDQPLAHDGEKDSEKRPAAPLGRIYIAGPMRGRVWYNFPEFDIASAWLHLCGYEPVNPADLDRACGFDPYALPRDHDWSQLPPNFDFKACRKRDLDALETCQKIYLLRGWRDSVGARAEHAHAEWIGLRVIEQE